MHLRPDCRFRKGHGCSRSKLQRARSLYRFALRRPSRWRACTCASAGIAIGPCQLAVPIPRERGARLTYAPEFTAYLLGLVDLGSGHAGECVCCRTFAAVRSGSTLEAAQACGSHGWPNPFTAAEWGHAAATKLHGRVLRVTRTRPCSQNVRRAGTVSYRSPSPSPRQHPDAACPDCRASDSIVGGSTDVDVDETVADLSSI